MNTSHRSPRNSNRLPVLAAEIRKAHAGVQEAEQVAAQGAINVGHALIEVKTLVKNGEWLPWLKEHCRISERTAQLYMRIARFGIKPATIADLGGINAAASFLTMHKTPDPGRVLFVYLRNEIMAAVTPASEYPGYFHLAFVADDLETMDRTKRPVAERGVWLFIHHKAGSDIAELSFENEADTAAWAQGGEA